MLDPIQLESFLAVAQTRNFTEAGRRLGLRQSTVSQHIRKLEQAAGRRLFVRDTHSRGADRGWRGDDRLRPLDPGGERAGAAITSPARSCAAGCGSARRRISSAPACRSCCATSSAAIALVDLELTVGLSATPA